MSVTSPNKFKAYGWLVCAWVLVASFQYGYHISALNQIQAVLTCRRISPAQSLGVSLPTCIPMSDAEFSVVTAVFTIGGFLGSLSSDYLQDNFGRKGALRFSGSFTALGASFIAATPNYTLLILGRTLVGVGSGIGLCVGPIFLSEISPASIKGSVGVLTQFAIVIGIMVTQIIGLRLATPTGWRTVPSISCAISLLQLLISPGIVETPQWLRQHNKEAAAAAVEHTIWVSPPMKSSQDRDVEAPLLEEEPSSPRADYQEREETVSLKNLLSTPRLRRPLIIVCSAMISQQVSGINAVLYYSNDILSKSLPELGPYVSLGVTIVNVLMTFPPIFLIDRMGRKQLLYLSINGAVLSLIMVGVGINSGATTLSSVAIMAFVMSFAIGLGPVPFVIIPEVSPPEAVSALSSTALSLNWVANFFVGLTFLPLRNALSGGRPDREGRVFFVFVGALVIFSFILLRAYRG